MFIVTAGDHRFQAMIGTSRRQAERFGYRFCAYDLGGLEGGRPLESDDDSAHDFRHESFAQNGYYLEVDKGWRSRALHKPQVVEQALNAEADFVAYLDGDAILLDRIDELAHRDYDVGLVVRPNGETTSHPRIAGPINAGVMFFQNTDRARRFVARWAAETGRVKNDQMAVNNLLCEGLTGWQSIQSGKWFKDLRRQILGHKTNTWMFDGSEIPETRLVDGVRVRFFDHRYNCYTFPMPRDAKIVHFKAPYRDRFDDFLFLQEKLHTAAA